MVRTRFAPSPTGDPHVGNVRTAIFAWAQARASGGQFILRLEDTDQNRLVPESVERIYDSLRWLGLDWDEGPDVGGPHAPYVQSERLPLYQEAASRLIAEGKAYRCFCTAERLDAMRAQQAAAKQPPGYDGRCRTIPPAESAARAMSEPFTVRFKMKREGQTVLHDLVRGAVVFENALQDDFVALKSDGFPTYHLAVVVDDTAMGITHAIRGEEWISSAPKHLQLYEALGWAPTAFAHLPLILGPDHKKLSKRSGDTALLDYRDRGYLPEAMLNFLALLGWSLDEKTNLLSREELASAFTIERVVPNPAVFDAGRLDWLNGHYVRQMSPEAWLETVVAWAERGLPPSVPRPLDHAVLAAAAPLLQERVARLEEIPAMVAPLFGFQAPEFDAALLTERAGGPAAAVRVLDAAILALDRVGEGDWTREAVEAAVRSLEETLGQKLRKFVAVLYVAVLGSPQGTPLFDSLAILGRERALERLRAARARAEHRG
ncbi:MAG: glutamate--tRNA ligase [Dehalococcoidia bacterium]|nr:glutamate--tRNA ligase [Dehalococcoidia bacterium]